MRDCLKFFCKGLACVVIIVVAMVVALFSSEVSKL